MTAHEGARRLLSFHGLVSERTYPPAPVSPSAAPVTPLQPYSPPTDGYGTAIVIPERQYHRHHELGTRPLPSEWAKWRGLARALWWELVDVARRLVR